MRAVRSFLKASPHPGNGLHASRRCFGWTQDEQLLNFRVKGDGVNVQKLAGGILLRCEQGLQTVLDSMGSKSIYNCIRALVLANRYAQRRREEAIAEGKQPLVTTPLRVGFVPRFQGSKGHMWMRLQVVPISRERGTAEPAQDALEPMKTSARTEIRSLSDAILNQWLQHCGGRTAGPVIAAMGRDCVSTSVKGAAMALKELQLRRSGARPFVCHPRMEQQPEPGKPGEQQTVTYIALEFHHLANAGEQAKAPTAGASSGAGASSRVSATGTAADAGAATPGP